MFLMGEQSSKSNFILALSLERGVIQLLNCCAFYCITGICFTQIHIKDLHEYVKSGDKACLGHWYDIHSLIFVEYLTHRQKMNNIMVSAFIELKLASRCRVTSVMMVEVQDARGAYRGDISSNSRCSVYSGHVSNT